MGDLIRTILATLLTAGLLTMPATAHAVPHKPCKHEDSTGCVWDARHMGNGAGKSFIARRDGTITYVTHRRAHRLIHG